MTGVQTCALPISQAIIAVQKATAEGLEMIKSVGADESLIKLKSLESLEKVANGQATKLIIPTDLQNMAGLVSSISELAKQ